MRNIFVMQIPNNHFMLHALRARFESQMYFEAIFCCIKLMGICKRAAKYHILKIGWLYKHSGGGGQIKIVYQTIVLKQRCLNPDLV